MIHQVHARGNEIVLEDDFEWVNAWAAAQRPAAPKDAEDIVVASAPAAVPQAVAPVAEPPVRPSSSRRTVPQPDGARELFVPGAPSQSFTHAVDEVGKSRLRPAIVADPAGQLARDIAEIEMVRDRLSALPVGTLAAASAPSRTSDYVPILVGAVLAFASLVVFGAAALFVSLR